MVKYVIHPGWVWSKTDGDDHYITYGKLISLYKVSSHECVRYDNHGFSIDRICDNYIHLFPRYDGDYQITKEDTK
jgi:hypothetical protein